MTLIECPNCGNMVGSNEGYCSFCGEGLIKQPKESLGATGYLVAGSIISYIIAIVFISLGFNKMLVYANYDSRILKSKNVYVGGDAYNYIINANYAAAYFTLAGIFCIIGATFIISYVLFKTRKTNQ